MFQTTNHLLYVVISGHILLYVVDYMYVCVWLLKKFLHLEPEFLYNDLRINHQTMCTYYIYIYIHIYNLILIITIIVYIST